MASKKSKNPLQPAKNTDTKGPKAKKTAPAKPVDVGEEQAATKENNSENLQAPAEKLPAAKKINTKKNEAGSAVKKEPAARNQTVVTAKKATKNIAVEKALPVPPGDTTTEPAPELKTEEARPEKKFKNSKAKKATQKIEVPFEPVTKQPVAAADTPSISGEENNSLNEAAVADKISVTGETPSEVSASAEMPQTEEAPEPDVQQQEQPTQIITESEPVTTPQENSIDEKNHAVAHKLAATKAHKKTGVSTISFYLRFHSNPGQNLFITAQHPLFGNGNPEDALPMQFLNDETWTANFPVNDDFKGTIVYNYLLKEPDGSYVFDAGRDKVLDISSFTTEELSIVDSWNVAGYFENAFYTEPFKEVLLKNNYTATEYAEPAVYTHTFKVKAPLLAQGQVVYITGSIPELSAWSADKTLLLHKNKDEDFWFIDLDLTSAHFPLEYKYGVYDIRADKAVQVENGRNRTFFDTVSPSRKTLVNDGFIWLPNDTWKGAGIAIPVFSLKSENSLGIGEFSDIKTLVDWAKQAGLKLIQLLPVNDTTATKTWQDSYPYSAISAFALHAMYLNLAEVVNEEHQHFLQQYEEEGKRLNALPSIDYERVNDIKWKVIHHIYPLQKEAIFSGEDYKEFFENNKHWLVPYAAFCYLRDKNNTADCNRWQDNKTYDEQAINTLLQSPDVKDIAGMYYFVQYYLHLQLKEATDYAHANGIIVKGDIAIGVSLDSVDTWQQPALFNLNMQAGAPPDDFAVKGQNWGFPTYNWQKMQEDGFAWWKKRFEQMSYYFDAFRIDHILGFFRIWSIPSGAIEGILGRFVPALPVHISEFHQRGIYFDYNRYTKPFINDEVLNDLFGNQQWWVKDNLLHAEGDGLYSLKGEVNTQMRVQTYFSIREDNPHNQWLKATLFDLISNVILFEGKGSNGQQFHFRFGMEETTSYKQLDAHTQWQLRELSINYFYDRQNDFWYRQAKNILPALKQATNMLICGEDLGMVPASVPKLMGELGLLSLEVQRMPKDHRLQFAHIAAAPYLSVVTPSTHDMSTIRGWWEEDKAITQLFYNQELGQQGSAPQYCEAWINKKIIDQHLQSPAMWSIFQLQDLLGSDDQLRRPNPQEEQINKPATSKFYWQYRMHVTLENLMKAGTFNNDLKESIVQSGR